MLFIQLPYLDKEGNGYKGQQYVTVIIKVAFSFVAVRVS